MLYAAVPKQSGACLPHVFLLGLSMLSRGKTTSLAYNRKNGENFVDSLTLNLIAASV